MKKRVGNWGKNDLFLMNKNKKGQITVFVILALCIVVVLILLFSKQTNITSIFAKENPGNEIEKCIEEIAKAGIEQISKQGGEVDPKNFFLINSTKVGYICYTNQYYRSCVMQKPMLKPVIEEELKKYIENNSENCLQNIKQGLEQKGYSVMMDKPEARVELFPANVRVIAFLNMEIVKDTTQTFNQVKVDISSNIYDFSVIASSIANWEARYGDSETMNYMYFHPDLKVEKKMQSDGTKIYILTNRNLLDKFVFATRSYARPPGVTGN